MSKEMDPATVQGWIEDAADKAAERAVRSQSADTRLMVTEAVAAGIKQHATDCPLRGTVGDLVVLTYGLPGGDGGMKQMYLNNNRRGKLIDKIAVGVGVAVLVGAVSWVGWMWSSHNAASASAAVQPTTQTAKP